MAERRAPQPLAGDERPAPRLSRTSLLDTPPIRRRGASHRYDNSRFAQGVTIVRKVAILSKLGPVRFIRTRKVKGRLLNTTLSHLGVVNSLTLPEPRSAPREGRSSAQME